VSKYVKAHDGMLLANHGALTLGSDVYAAYYKMETIEHFANISFVARMLGGERLLSRDEVMRLQGLRGRYGIAAPAPICPDPDGTPEQIQQDCQVVFAPPSVSGERLVPDRFSGVGADEEIRLTYRELTTLIEDAVRNLK
jgi:L-fuculose-phosphate aldolase